MTYPDAGKQKTDRTPELSGTAAGLTPELRFLLLESLRSPSPEQDREALSLLTGSFDFNGLASLASGNGLCPVLAKNLQRLGLSREELRPVLSLADSCKFRSIQYIAELVRIFRLFEKNGIRAVSLKGPVLAQSLYGSPALRSYGDVDILVDPGRYAEARNLLLENGYAPVDYVTTEKRLRYMMSNPIFHHTALNKNGVCVELHWKSIDLEPLSFDEMYRGRQNTVFFDTELPAPGIADTLLLLIRHGCHHGFCQFKWVMDLCELFGKADNADLLSACRRFSETDTVFALYTFLLFSEKLGLLSVKKEPVPADGVPAGLCNCFLQKNEDGSLLLKAPLSGDAFTAAGELSDAALADVLRSSSCPSDMDHKSETERNYSMLLRKIRYRLGLAGRYEEFFKLISPGSQDFELIPLPDSLFFLYYPIRILYWIQRRVLSRQSPQE